MTDKTIDLLKFSSELSHPLSRQEIMEILESLSKNDEEIWDYISGCTSVISNISLWRDILLSISNRPRCESLIYALNEEQLTNFSRIVMSLKLAIEFDDFSEIPNAIFNAKNPTETSLVKAAILLDTITKVENCNLEATALSLLKFSNQMKLLAGIYFNYKKKKPDYQWPVSLAQMSEEDLDELIKLSNLTVENILVK